MSYHFSQKQDELMFFENGKKKHFFDAKKKDCVF